MRLLEGLVDLVFPPECCRCGRWLRAGDEVLCESCRAALPWIAGDRCVRCQEAGRERHSGVCAGCWRARPLLLSCTAPVRFEAEVADWLRRLKYPRTRFDLLDPKPAAIAGLLARESAVSSRRAHEERVDAAK